MLPRWKGMVFFENFADRRILHLFFWGVGKKSPFSDGYIGIERCLLEEVVETPREAEERPSGEEEESPHPFWQRAQSAVHTYVRHTTQVFFFVGIEMQVKKRRAQQSRYATENKKNGEQRTNNLHCTCSLPHLVSEGGSIMM